MDSSEQVEDCAGGKAGQSLLSLLKSGREQSSDSGLARWVGGQGA